MFIVLFLKIYFLSFLIVNAIILIRKGNLGGIRNHFLGWSLLIYSLYILAIVHWFEKGLGADYSMLSGSPLVYITALLFCFDPSCRGLLSIYNYLNLDRVFLIRITLF
ncbi:hypothetical protein LV83_01523 [Algoriphagus yeomjeoni]|uniref:Uncharacterized protein n=1 Tax=Algoriphagus yeomjeoni TaxID=291403 RepID=A0A327PL05_9BACT|nr:hypothetical protein LV83_01523 [Algoriphagus yeomjeoni]